MTTSGPLVSVVIPAFNCAAYLEETLGSVAGQTLGDFEVVVVDDGSTDGTKELLDRLAEPRLRVVAQDRRGPAAARNRGIELARGRYIAFLDADDLWEPDKLELQVQFMEHAPQVGLCFTDWTWLQAPPGVPSAFEAARSSLARLPVKPAGMGWVVTSASLFADYLLRGPIPCWTSTVMVRRSTLALAGLFDEHLRGDEDTHLWLRLVKTAPVGYLRRVLARRRARPASVTTSTVDAEAYAVSADSIASLERHLSLTRDERAAVRARVSQLHRAAGYCRLARGDVAGARRQFLASFVARPSLSSLGYLLLATLPAPLVAAVRSAKRRVSRGSLTSTSAPEPPRP